MPSRVAIATFAAEPEITVDDQLLVDALRQRGIEVAAAVWDDPAVDWSGIDLCLLRSTWDYHHRREDFLARLRHISAVTSLWNPLSVVHWNSHKGYLRDLAAQGVATVPTRWLDAGSSVDLDTLLETSGWPTPVIKLRIHLRDPSARACAVPFHPLPSRLRPSCVYPAPDLSPQH